jgi:hypothetical protein
MEPDDAEEDSRAINPKASSTLLTPPVIARVLEVAVIMTRILSLPWDTGVPFPITQDVCIVDRSRCGIVFEESPPVNTDVSINLVTDCKEKNIIHRRKEETYQGSRRQWIRATSAQKNQY